MPKVILKGHTYTYPVADLLTLFTGETSRSVNNEITSGDDSVLIYSEITDFSISTWTDNGLSVTSDRKSLRLPVNREMKRQLYMILTQIYHRTFPWGSLTGIRPTLVAAEEKYPQQLVDTYHVRLDKADLAVRVAQEENRILDDIRTDSYSVYIGIPYCPTRCSYCSFIAYESAGRKDRLAAYASALLYEIQTFFRQTKIHPSYLYIGGGTPSVFDDESFFDIYHDIFAAIPTDSMKEITVEMGRADTITENKLRVLKSCGVNRICINPQTTNDQTLKRLGRNHSAKEFFQAYETAMKVGFAMINTDLIAGLPDETEIDFRQTLTDIISLRPENITVHTLSKKRCASLSSSFTSLLDSSSDAIDPMLTFAQETLIREEYHPYYLYRQKNTLGGHENTGYAKKGHECVYNIAMMSDRRSVIGFGAGSISKNIKLDQRIERCPNVKNPEEYMKRVDEMARRKIAFYQK